VELIHVFSNQFLCNLLNLPSDSIQLDFRFIDYFFPIGSTAIIKQKLKEQLSEHEQTVKKITHFPLLTNTFSMASGKSKAGIGIRNSLTFRF